MTTKDKYPSLKVYKYSSKWLNNLKNSTLLERTYSITNMHIKRWSISLVFGEYTAKSLGWLYVREK